MNMDLVKVYIVNGGTLAVVTTAEIETGLKILLLLVSIGYTVHKWRKSKRDE